MDIERKKWNILVAIDEVPDPVWERFRSSACLTFLREGQGTYQALLRETFDLVFLDLHLSGMDSLELLRRCRRERLCASAVLTSLVPSFTYAQQGILYGVTAYLLRPLRAEDIEQVLEKLRASENPDLPFREAARAIVSRLWAEGAEESFFETGHKFITEEDPVRRSLRWRELYEAVISETFQTYPWLRLYHHPEEYSSLDYIRESDSDMVVGFCLRKLDGLSQSIRELFPIAKNPKLEELFTFLLHSIDENVQQKEVAERYFITSSTLSTRFQRGLGISYREYMTTLKLLRGQYLLQHTDIRPEDLATRLGYKDKEYFAKLFLQRTGHNLQTYRQEVWGKHYNI